MIKSMTGFGKAAAEIPGKKILVEIKSLNSKQLDLNLRLPWLYKEKEAELRNLISQRLDRGKIDLNIAFDVLESEIIPVINKSVVKNYYFQLRDLAAELGINSEENLLPAIMRLPDAMKTEKPELNDNEWTEVLRAINESIVNLDQFRQEEGKSIGADMSKCLSSILSHLEKIEASDGDRILRTREKLNSLMEEHVGAEKVDMNRFEQELIYYLEKIDINEEKVRLKKHCEYFIEKMSEPSPNGKILNFIAQEIGREINTIGSKANDASLQKMVIMMKDELEKIKEQTLNVL